MTTTSSSFYDEKLDWTERYKAFAPPPHTHAAAALAAPAAVLSSSSPLPTADSKGPPIGRGEEEEEKSMVASPYELSSFLSLSSSAAIAPKTAANNLTGFQVKPYDVNNTAKSQAAPSITKGYPYDEGHEGTLLTLAQLSELDQVQAETRGSGSGSGSGGWLASYANTTNAGNGISRGRSNNDLQASVENSIYSNGPPPGSKNGLLLPTSLLSWQAEQQQQQSGGKGGGGGRSFGQPQNSSNNSNSNSNSTLFASKNSNILPMRPTMMNSSNEFPAKRDINYYDAAQVNNGKYSSNNMANPSTAAAAAAAVAAAQRMQNHPLRKALRNDLAGERKHSARAAGPAPAAANNMGVQSSGHRERSRSRSISPNAPLQPPPGGKGAIGGGSGGGGGSGEASYRYMAPTGSSVVKAKVLSEVAQLAKIKTYSGWKPAIK
jgi:hypothetical protein